MNIRKTSFRMQQRWDLIQPCHHLILGQRLEVRRFEIEVAGYETGTNVLGHKLLVEIRPNGQFCSLLAWPLKQERGPVFTMVSEIEQSRKISSGPIRMTRVRQTCARIPQLVKEWLHHCVDRGESLGRRVF
jgi:hypothetical protein